MDHGGLEREFKLQLASPEASARLRAALGSAPARAARQENHFYDTPARTLSAARLALRLRAEEGRWFLTLKGPRQGDRGALSTRAEEELELDAQTAQALLAPGSDPLAVLERALGASPLVGAARAARAAAPLVRLGSFTNERLRLGPLTLEGLAAGLVLELDHTHFPGGVETHELELEVPEQVDPAAVEAALRALFTRLDLPWRAGENKAARFFRLLDARAGS